MTGNPLIKEKIDLEMDIAKLNILKAGFNKQKYHSQESCRRIPNEIVDIEKIIVKVKQDIQMTESIKPNHDVDGNEYYPIKIKGNEYHDRTDGGKALVAAITSTDGLVTGKNIDLGEYRGFNVSAFYDILSHKVNVCLAGENKYYGELNLDSSTAHSNIVRLDNMIKNLPTQIQSLNNKLDILKGNLLEAEKESVKEFPQQQELSEKENRLIEVDKMLRTANSVDTLSKDLYNGLYALCPDVVGGNVKQQDFNTEDDFSISVRHCDKDEIQIFSDYGTVCVTAQIKDEFAYVTGFTDSYNDISEHYSKADSLNEDCVDIIRDVLENIEDGEFVVEDLSSEHDILAEDFGIDMDDYSR